MAPSNGEHHNAIKIAELFQRFDTLKSLMDERDVRYAQIAEAKERAINAVFAAAEKAVSTAMAAAEKAVFVAERNAEKWRDNANEWRGAMTDKDRNFVTKSVLWAYMVGAVSLTLLIVSVVLKVAA